MQNAERDQAFPNLIRIFADIFKFPDYEFYQELVSGDLDNEINRLCAKLGFPVITNFKAFTGTYDELTKTYNNCFLGIKTPFASPVESVYKVWTRDQSFQVPHKNQKGYLMGDSALHIQHILQTLGLEIPAEYEMMPDHITILLELYAYFHEKGLYQEANQFKRDHLDWIPELYSSLEKIQGNQPYESMVSKLNQIIDSSYLEIN